MQDMRQVEFVPFRLTEVAEIFSIKIDGKESFFRPEGKMNDRVCAIPLLTSFRQKQNGTIRLYCIRISDKLLIVGGGGIKTTRTYNEDEILSGHIKTLQMIDKELSYLENQEKDLHQELYNLKIHID